jgi:serine/threonine protein kinase
MPPGELAEKLQRAVGDRYQLEANPPPVSPSRPPWRLFLALEGTGRRVAIKAAPTEGLDETVPLRFDREVGSVDRPPGWLGLPSLDHPRLLPVLAKGWREGVLFYVTPWLAEGSLRPRLSREGLSVADAVTVLDEMAEALGLLHALGAAHGGVTPENILFDAGHAVLADGFSRLLAAAPDARRLVDYAAPEVIRGEKPDSRSDIHALATIGYEMLAGRRPFTGTLAEVAYATVTGTPPSLSRLRSETSPPLVELLERALDKSPEGRPDATTFRGALRRVLTPQRFGE